MSSQNKPDKPKRPPTVKEQMAAKKARKEQRQLEKLLEDPTAEIEAFKTSLADVRTAMSDAEALFNNIITGINLSDVDEDKAEQHTQFKNTLTSFKRDVSDIEAQRKVLVTRISEVEAQAPVKHDFGVVFSIYNDVAEFAATISEVLLPQIVTLEECLVSLKK